MEPINNALFSHKRDNWKTPKKIYNDFMQNGFYDPCPSNPTEDGLKTEWKMANYVNPPYSKIKDWVNKAIEESNKGKNVVILVPARTDTKWFKKLYDYGSIFYFVEGRLKFDDGKEGAPFPSVFIKLVGGNYSFIRLLKKDDIYTDSEEATKKKI